MTTGFLYIATDKEYLNEAKYSASQLRKHHDDPNIAVITNEDLNTDVFDDVVMPNDSGEGFGVKVYNLHKLPYDRTIYLDTDTYVTDDISGLFSLLDRYDVCCVRKQDYYVRDSYLKSIPDCYPEFNTGVIGLKRNKKTAKLLDTFKEYWENNKGHLSGDQQAFRYATYAENVQLIQIGPEYNCRFTLPGLLTEEAKIFHGRKSGIPYASDKYHEYISNISAAINKYPTSPRVFIPLNDSFHVYLPPSELESETIISKIIGSIKHRGLAGFIKHIYNRLTGDERYTGWSKYK